MLVDHFNINFKIFFLDTGITATKGICPCNHEGSHQFIGKRLSNLGCDTPYKVFLKIIVPVLWKKMVNQSSTACVNPINAPLLIGPFINHCPAVPDFRPVFLINLNFHGKIITSLHKFLNGQCITINNKCIVFNRHDTLL